MATVRMSDRLVWGIRDEAKNQFDNINPKKEFPMSIGDAIYKEKIAPFINKITPIVEEYNFRDVFKLEAHEELSVGLLGVDNTVSDNAKIPMSASRDLPTYRYGSCTIDLEATDENAIAIKEILNFNEDIGIRRTEYEDKVKEALGNFTTLNQALKAWPAVKKLIPDEEKHLLARVYEKVQRKKKQDQQRAEIELNETELNEVILTNSLIGGD
tara:strand:- start:25897 stop:26535 length:639 start_codon:yes stop_codon:yes gene_type:complete